MQYITKPSFCSDVCTIYEFAIGMRPPAVRYTNFWKKKMKNLGLIPNISVGIFVLESSIDKYLHLTYKVKHVNEKSFSYDSYYFTNYDIIVWGEDSVIKTICCDKECWWKGVSLVGLKYEDFLVLAKQNPDGEDICYVSVPKDRGQNQRV